MYQDPRPDYPSLSSLPSVKTFVAVEDLELACTYLE
jgi:hypothetical protein